MDKESAMLISFFVLLGGIISGLMAIAGAIVASQISKQE